MRVYFSQVERKTIHARQIVSRPGFLREMATLHHIWFDWIQSGNRTSGDAIEESWKRTREFIERNRRNPLGWMAMIMSAPYHNLGASSYQSVAEAWQLFEADPQHGYTARYERMRSLLNGGLPQTARLVFDDMYRQTLAAGVIPPLDGDVSRLPPNDEGATWGMTLVKAAGELARKNRGFEALAIADQCRQLSQLPLAQQVLAEMEPNLKKAGPSLRLATALALARLGEKARADDYLSPLLSERGYERMPMVWRLAADLAGQRQNSARVAKYLEKALDLEWEHLPEVVDIEALRADYVMLLQTYSQLVAAHRQTDTKPPGDLAARAVKFGDRWRCVDPDPTLACQAVARILRDLGETDRAWEYLTSPIAMSPGEAAPYQKLAEELKANGDNILAEKAYAAAFAAEPTNAQYLMDQATLLQQLGKSAEARKLWQKLADGTWQPRFDAVKNQANSMLRQ
jgi:tetratricopeptide (TPR) repeat protein